jgi:DNA (cytosine-5)-methyltransferase 1
MNKMKKEDNKPTVIDLFCGIGGFSKGFERQGFDVLFGIDNWDVALETFKKNHEKAEAINGDVREIEDDFYKKYNGNIDVIIAGPPCQGFSMSGRRDINDKRNTLFEEVIRAVKLINPKIIVIENVVGLLSMKNPDGEFVKDLIHKSLEELGYNVKHQILNASDYGVPQSRKRVIFLASRIGDIDFPEPYNYKITVGDALGNIPDVNEKHYLGPQTDFQKSMSNGVIQIFNHEAMNHNDKVLNRIRHVPPGGNWKDIPPEVYDVGGEHSNNYRRLDPNKPSITLKHATKSMIIHPKFNRVITAREVARLQSFPDSFLLAGTRFDQHQQLANAVPPILGEAITKVILKKIKEIENGR